MRVQNFLRFMFTLKSYNYNSGLAKAMSAEDKR
ncbi:hypothetical protein PI125_g7608 [Phytophthora idaei]|nr:hypothetical protein PI125_g7608 [Phytophthora idaei]KAG3158294.1 hypothetical protein PI126_g7924 [Phytophthora idaei]